MVEARHDAGDVQTKIDHATKKANKNNFVPTAHIGLPNIYKFLRTSTQGSGFKIGNSTREREFNEFK